MAAPAPPRLDDASWLTRPETKAVFTALAARGFAARAVGGVVRNALLGRPVTDVDIATPARPDEVMAAAQAAGLTAVPTGLAHGTVTVIASHVPYEITTLREDVETHGRHATVAFTDDWAADARRRDFTINALYCSADGEVFDPLGAYADLAAAPRALHRRCSRANSRGLSAHPALLPPDRRLWRGSARCRGPCRLRCRACGTWRAVGRAGAPGDAAPARRGAGAGAGARHAGATA